MAIKLKHSDTFSTYFITFTCTEWIPLFDITNSYDLIYKWFNILKEKYCAGVVSYVIMPNHLHTILHFYKEGFNLNSIISNGKRFMAYEIINRLASADNKAMLEKLSKLITEREKKKGQLHKVFKDSFDAKAIITQQFLLQKINYIHNNLSKKGFNDLEYLYSSASYYETGVRNWDFLK